MMVLHLWHRWVNSVSLLWQQVEGSQWRPRCPWVQHQCIVSGHPKQSGQLIIHLQLREWGSRGQRKKIPQHLATNNNDNRYSGHLTCTGPKRLRILLKCYVFSRYSAYNTRMLHTPFTHAQSYIRAVGLQNRFLKSLRSTHVSLHSGPSPVWLLSGWCVSHCTTGASDQCNVMLKRDSLRSGHCGGGSLVVLNYPVNAVCILWKTVCSVEKPL